ncbi:hypothetical protein SDC9_177834 [bioreactor metagenome]|uniref:Uncharacterized protein n=1 Tax=bioreactor metagenome TaxID=1076179 RepID=A0A645H3F8_9ZZZZ
MANSRALSGADRGIVDPFQLFFAFCDGFLEQNVISAFHCRAGGFHVLVVLGRDEYRVRLDSGIQRRAPVRKHLIFGYAISRGKSGSSRLTWLGNCNNLELVGRKERVWRIGIHAARARAENDHANGIHLHKFLPNKIKN